MNSRETVVKHTTQGDQSGVLINTSTNELTAMHESLLHVREITTNFTNSLTNDDTSSANDITQLLRE